MTSSRWVAFIAVAATFSPAYAAGPESAAVSPEAQASFERALSLDVGEGGAPDAVRAFAEMRRAAEAGDPQAAFNVGVMLDSGRGVRPDTAQAAVWYARAAARGDRRGAFNLGQLYEAGDGVPMNADLARAWYAASNLPAARNRMSGLNANAGRPTRLQPPKPTFPVGVGLPEAAGQQVDLVWTSSLEPEPVRYFVELRRLDAHSSAETWSGFVDVSSVSLPLPPGVGTFAWRASAVARGLADYAYSGWSIFTVPHVSSPDVAGGLSAGVFETGAIAPRAVKSEAVASKPNQRAAESPPQKLPETPTPSVSSEPPKDAVANAPQPAASTSLPSPDADGAKVAVADPQNSAGRQRGVMETGSPQPRPSASPTSSGTNKNEVAVAPSPDVTIPQNVRPEFSASSADPGFVTPAATSTVLIILAQPSVARLADLNNKAVVIAGLTTISRSAVGAALNAAGAGSAQLVEGAKGDVDQLVDGKVSAAVIACVSTAKSQTFPEIAGFRLLRVAVPETKRAD